MNLEIFDQLMRLRPLGELFEVPASRLRELSKEGRIREMRRGVHRGFPTLSGRPSYLVDVPLYKQSVVAKSVGLSSSTIRRDREEGLLEMQVPRARWHRRATPRQVFEYWHRRRALRGSGSLKRPRYFRLIELLLVQESVRSAGRGGGGLKR